MAFNSLGMAARGWPRAYYEADGAGGGATSAEVQAEAAEAQAQEQADGGQQETGAEGARYTLEEVQKLIQSETDKRITQAQKKWQREHERQLALAGMTDDARAAAQKDDRIRELEEQLSEANRYKARNSVLAQLSEKGLPAQLADVITIEADDDEMNAARVSALDQAIRAAVEAQVKARLSGKAPAAGTAKPAGMTREAYMKLSLSQKAQLAQSDPETYKRLNE